MSLVIKEFIIHEIIKEANGMGIFNKATESVSKDDDLSLALVNELHKGISNSTKKAYGVFVEGEKSSLFKIDFSEYINVNESFFNKSIELTGSKSQGSLLNLLNKKNLATGGYIIYIDYLIHNERFFIVCMLNNKQGKSIEIDKAGKPKIKNTQQLEISNLDLACRINISKFKNDDSTYLCFIHKTSKKKPSDYFVEFLGCKKFNSEQSNSIKLVSIIKAITSNLENKGQIRKDAHTYCLSMSKVKKPIDIFELSMSLFGEEKRNFIFDYAVKNDKEIDHSFSIYKSEVDKLVTVIIKKADWIDEIKFDSKFIKNFKINEDNQDIMLKNVPELISLINQEKGL